MPLLLAHITPLNLLGFGDRLWKRYMHDSAQPTLSVGHAEHLVISRQPSAISALVDS